MPKLRNTLHYQSFVVSVYSQKPNWFILSLFYQHSIKGSMGRGQGVEIAAERMLWGRGLCVHNAHSTFSTLNKQDLYIKAEGGKD